MTKKGGRWEESDPRALKSHSFREWRRHHSGETENVQTSLGAGRHEISGVGGGKMDHPFPRRLGVEVGEREEWADDGGVRRSDLVAPRAPHTPPFFPPPKIARRVGFGLVPSYPPLPYPSYSHRLHLRPLASRSVHPLLPRLLRTSRRPSRGRSRGRDPSQGGGEMRRNYERMGGVKLTRAWGTIG